MLCPPLGIERFFPCAVEETDQPERADDEQRPLQYFRARRVRTKVFEQREVGHGPKRNQPRPVKEYGAQRDTRQLVRSLVWSGARRADVRPVDLRACCQWKSVRHDPVRQANSSSRAGRIGLTDSRTIQDEYPGFNTWVF